MFGAQLRGIIYPTSRPVLIAPEKAGIKSEIVETNDAIVSDNSSEQRAHTRHVDLQGKTDRFRRNDRRDTCQS